MRRAKVLMVIALTAGLGACATLKPRYASRPEAQPTPSAGSYKVGKPYQIGGVWYVPKEEPDYDRVGVASWYGDAFHLKATANGETFDMKAVSAAHTTLPLPSLVEVTNLENGRKLVVRVNDRGPFVDNRIIDLSREAARQLGFDGNGLAKVRVRYVGPAPLLGRDAGVRYAGGPALNQPSEPQPPQTLQSPPTAVQVAELPAFAPRPVFQVQAGAFASEANAQRAVAQLAAAGSASIEPLEREGLRLFRVVLPAPADEAEAFALRDRVAEIGFADARVVRPF